MRCSFPTYQEALIYARTHANTIRKSMGIEKPQTQAGPLAGWTVFTLPDPQNRQGHELTCEVVEPAAPSEGVLT